MVELTAAKAANSARVSAYGLSVNLGPARSGGLTACFTTYDGTANLPLFDQVGNLIRVSGELSPSGNGRYQTDFGLQDYWDWISYGTATVQFAATDGDANGVPDFLQPELHSNVTFSGNVTEQMPFVAISTINGRLSRQAGSLQGSYTAAITGESGGRTYTGATFLLNVSGKVDYTRGAQNQGIFQVRVTDSSGASHSYSTTTPFTVRSVNQIQIPATTFISSTGGGDIVSKLCTLNRSGQRYIGSLSLADGNLYTSWSDYTQWVLQIEDSNDRDADGIPDLSDTAPTPPTIISQPQHQTVTEGQSVTFTVTATGTTPFTYQWVKDGTVVPGGTATLTISRVSFADHGNYSVVVSSPGGSITSQPAKLTVKAAPNPPVVSQHPTSQQVSAGAEVAFSVAVVGTPPLTFQWNKNGVSLPGATNATFFLSDVTIKDAAIYGVVISNPAGQTESSLATLTVSLIDPQIVWPRPQSVSYGVVLSGRQLNAQANVPGTFIYNPPGGTKLRAGDGQVLTVEFLPADPLRYATATATVFIDITKAVQTITFAPLPEMKVGESVILEATASSGLPVTLTVVSGSGRIQQGILTLTTSGTIAIRAEQPGDQDFLAASGVEQSGTVASALGQAQLWNPAFRNGRFGFQVSVLPERSYRIEASTDCATWETLSIVTATSSLIDWSDDILQQPSRFYRVIAQ